MFLHPGPRPVFLLVVLLFLALLRAPTLAAELGVRYADPEGGFSIRPPGYWAVERQPMEGVRVVFIAPRYEGFVATLNVVARPEKIEITPATVAHLARQLEEGHAQKEAGKRLLRKKGAPADIGITGYRVTRTRIAKLIGGNAAFLEAEYIDTYNGKQTKTRNLQVVVPGPSGHAILTYTAVGSQYERYLPEVIASIDTFAWTSAAAGPSARPASVVRKAAALVVGLAAGIIVLVIARRRTRRKA
jgi:hypothetical protein